MNASSTSLAGALVGWLTDYYLLATLLLLVAFVGWRWVRQPAHRIMVAWTVMLELTVLAVVCALPSWPRVSLIATTSQKAVVELPAAGDHGFVARPPIPLAPVAKENPVSGARFELEASESVASPVAPKPHLAWIGLIAVGHLAGAALVGLWLCWGVAATTWVCKRARPAADPLQVELSRLVQGNGRPPRLLVSPHVVNAAALSVLRPTIVLPAGLAESGPPHTLRAVLSHEWAHIRNRDLWLLALGRCLLAVLFAHPLFWWLRRAIRSDQELLADAVAAGDNRQAYAEELLRLIRKTARPSPIAVSAAVGIWESSSQLSRRIAMLLDETFRVQPTGSRCWQCRALATLVLLGAACSLVTLQPAPLSGEEEAPGAAEAEKKGGETVDAGTTAEAHQQQRADQDANGSPPGHGKAGQPHGTEFVVVGSVSVSADAHGERVVLPGYVPLMRHAVLRELNITDKQKSELLGIQEEYFANRTGFFEKTLKSLPQKERADVQTRWQRKQRDGIRKQVEGVLSSAQAETLRELAFREAAFLHLFDPTVLAKLDVTASQQAKLSSICGEAPRWSKRHSQQTVGKLLAVLGPQQRAQLRELALGPLAVDHYMGVPVDLEGETEPVVIPSLFPYPDFSQERVQRELELSERQRNQVQRILGARPNLTEKLTEELRKLSPEERKKQRVGALSVWSVADSRGFSVGDDGLSAAEKSKQLAELEERQRKEQEKRRAEFEKQPMRRKAVELRRQFEAVLTQEQLAFYQEMAFRNVAEPVLRDPFVLKRVGASDQQKAAILRVFEESQEDYYRHAREMGGRMLKVLAPPQQEKLREAIDQRQW